MLVSSATALGPLIAAYMVQDGPGTWRNFVWLSAAVAGLNFVLLVLFYPESNFHRPQDASMSPEKSSTENDTEKAVSAHATEHAMPHGTQQVDHVHVPWTSIWFSFITIDKTISMPKTILRPLAFLASPNVLWAVFVYGTALSAQIILM